MIDESTKTIYVDYSTLATFDACKEKARLGNVLGWKPTAERLWFPFGKAMHAAIGGFYDALAGGWHDDHNVWHPFEFSSLQESNRIPFAKQAAVNAMLRFLKYDDSQLPIALESGERRSVERAIGLVEAYIHRWRQEPYENILDSNGVPYTEVGFQYPLAQFGDYRVVYVGYIDRLMRDYLTKRVVIFERKTTTQGLNGFIQQVKPNHQITGYFPPTLALFPDVRECVWDCIFISDRQADMKKALKDRFWMWGVDVEKDFARQKTSRSSQDITEFLFDAESRALDYCKWLTSGATRWPRSAPGACHSYGGCLFRNRCSINLDDGVSEANYLSSFFKIDKWEPWRKIVEKANGANGA